MADSVVFHMAAARGLPTHNLPSPLPLPPMNWETAPLTLPGDVYTSLLEDRHHRGSYYTPMRMAKDVVQRTLDQPAHIIDPSMGSGHFLLAAAQFLARDDPDRRHILSRLYGIDSDPTAILLAGLTLWLWARDPAIPLSEITKHFHCADALLDPLPSHFPPSFDTIIGNPPFASVFTRTQESGTRREAIKARYQTARGSFDLSVPFVERAVQLAGPEGNIGLVLPNKILSAHYAQRLREWLSQQVTVNEIVDWSEAQPFTAHVYPVALILKKTRPVSSEPLILHQAENTQPPRHTTQSELHHAPGSLWSQVFDPLWSKLQNCFENGLFLSHVATLSAGMTVSEAYRIKPHLRDLQGDQPPPENVFQFITTGSIRRYHTTWKAKPVRYLKAQYDQPVIPADALPRRRREQAASPKVIIAGMGRRPRALYDAGQMQAAVATTIITTSDYPLPALCAILNSTLIARLYRALFGGLALSGGYLRMTQRELGLLPIPNLPPDHDAFATLSHLAQQYHHPERDQHIDEIVYGLYGWTFQDIDQKTGSLHFHSSSSYTGDNESPA